MSTLYGDNIFSLNEGLFDNKSRPGKPRKKAITEAKKRYTFVLQFLDNKGTLGYNYSDTDVYPTILAAKYANIPESKILNIFKNDKNPFIKKHKSTIKKWFDFTKQGLEEFGTDRYNAFINARFDINEIINVISPGDSGFTGLLYRYKDNKFYQFPRRYMSDNSYIVKPIDFYSSISNKNELSLNDLFFNKEEFNIAMKEME